MQGSPTDPFPQNQRNRSNRMARVYDQDLHAADRTPFIALDTSVSRIKDLQSGAKTDEQLMTRVSPISPSLRSLSSSTSSSPVVYSPITPDADDDNLSSQVHIANPNDTLPLRLPRCYPSMPALDHKANEQSELFQQPILPSRVTKSNLPPPPAAWSLSDAYAVHLSGEAIRKSRRRGGGFERELALAYQQLKEELSGGTRPRHLDLSSTRTQEVADIKLTGVENRASSSTYSSSLYTTEEVAFDFPEPPKTSPEPVAYLGSPTPSEQDSCQINSSCQRRQSVEFGEECPPLAQSTVVGWHKPTRSVPSTFRTESVTGDGFVSDPDCSLDWINSEPEDFSWEACGSEDSDVGARGTDDILSDLGLSGNAKSLSRASPTQRVPFPTPGPVHEDSDVDFVLSALRSSYGLSVSGETDDTSKSDQAFKGELRLRLREKRSQQVARVATRRGTPPAPHAGTKDLPLHTKSRHDLEEGFKKQTPTIDNGRWTRRVVSPSLPPTTLPYISRHTSDTHSFSVNVSPGENHIRERQSVQERSSAFERLERCITKLQAYGPPQTPVLDSPMLSKERSDAPMPPTLRRTTLTRSTAVIKRKLDITNSSNSTERVELEAIKFIEPVRAARREKPDRRIRSPSAPDLAVSCSAKPMLAPAFSLSQLRQLPPEDYVRPPSREQVEAVKSFMDVTPEQHKIPKAHAHSRSSMGTLRADKAKKMLSRLSSTISGWRKGLARSVSTKN